MSATVAEYLKLTKPTIMLLVIFTGATALVVEGSMLAQPWRFLLFMVALFLTGGCANSLNQYFERDLDALMSRTAGRRPLPQRRLSPGSALTFSVAIGIAGLVILALFFNWLAALLALATILFYGLFYTLVLKPTTAQNIVIGGAAGAMAPVGAWAAATGTTGWLPWLMFGIIFFWTPPHFWALAIAYKDDYRLTGLPMMPLVRGERSTLRQMLVYAVMLVVTSLLPGLFGAGWVYLAFAATLGLVFLWRSVGALRSGSMERVRGLFRFSILYLFGLFLALLIDSRIANWF
ncbi:MAG: heme o synthase [Candidatus Zixiibacteriota bacterium]